MTGPSSAQMIPGTPPGTLQHRLRIYGPSGRSTSFDKYLAEYEASVTGEERDLYLWKVAEFERLQWDRP